MSDYFKTNDLTKAFGFDRIIALQQDLVKQASEVNKKVAVDFLRTAKAAVDVYSKNLDDEIRRLDSNQP